MPKDVKPIGVCYQSDEVIFPWDDYWEHDGKYILDEYFKDYCFDLVRQDAVHHIVGLK